MSIVKLNLRARDIDYIVGFGGQHARRYADDNGGLSSTPTATSALELGDTVESVNDNAKRVAALLITLADAACVQSLNIVMATEAGHTTLCIEMWRAPDVPGPVWQNVLKAVEVLGYTCRAFPIATEDSASNVIDSGVVEIIVA
jgi:hypothetical protein